MIESRCPLPVSVRLADGSICNAAVALRIWPGSPAVLEWSAREWKSGAPLPGPLAAGSVTRIDGLVRQMARKVGVKVPSGGSIPLATA